MTMPSHAHRPAQTDGATSAAEGLSAPSSVLPRTAGILSDVSAETSREKRAAAIARAILSAFDDYYVRSRSIPYRAKDAFERRDWPAMVDLARERLTVYGRNLISVIELLRETWPHVADERGFWVEIEANYLDFIHRRYEADLAFAFLRSTRRQMRHGEWAPVAYFAGREWEGPEYDFGYDILRRFPVPGRTTPGAIAQVLNVPRFDAAFRDLDADTTLIADKINAELDRRDAKVTGVCALKVVDAGFYRNRGAYILAHIVFDSTSQDAQPDFLPIVIALLHESEGIYADAVLFEADEIHAVFSSALANFHVTEEHYHQLADFLHQTMPKRPLGLHYSTIGFNHIGKVAVMRELQRERAQIGEAMGFALGMRGTVAIGFSMPSSRYILKVIRDKPTDGYKWETFDGVEAVLDKYRIVHENDRAGSMLDNIMYENVRIERSWFADELLQELARAAPSNVIILHRYVLFRHLIVQMKLIPLPQFLETSDVEARSAAVFGLGQCIRNNAAANIFNKDLDARNYGVSRIGKVYLFDYDAVETLVDVKVRTNRGRVDGEEDIPDWFFEDGVIFLPEEMMVGLRIDDRDLRRHFTETHGELMTIDYWEGMQRALRNGLVPKVRTYSPDRKLRPAPV